MSNLFYKTDSKNNTGVGTNIIEAQSVGLTLDFSKIGESNGVIKMNDNLSNALNITEGNNSYIQFKTKNNEEQIRINKNINIPDSTPIFLGSGSDGIIEHTGANLQIKEKTGNIQISNYANDKNIVINTDDGSGGTTNYFKADGSNGETTLYHYGSEKIKTISSGINITGDLTTSGRTQINDSTEATTTLDGSLQTDGGLSVVKNAVMGNDVKLLSDSAVLSLGADSDATFTHDGTTGLTIAATPISVVSTGSLDLSSTTGDINFQDGGVNQLALDMDGTVGEVIMQLKVDSDDFVFKQYDGTEVFRVEDNGDFDIAGGAGNSGATITSTGQLTTDGRIIVDDTTDATSTTNGSLQTDGGLSVAKDAVMGNDVKLLSDNAVLSLGAGSDATLAHDGTTGLTIAATPISVDSTGSLDLSSTTGDINLQASGTNQLSIDMDGTAGEVITQLKIDSDDFVFKQYDGTEVFRVEDNGDFDIAGGAGNSGLQQLLLQVN